MSASDWASGRSKSSRYVELGLQLLLVLLLLGVIYLIYASTRVNLQRLGVQSGFAFLDKAAGFAIAQALITYDESSTIRRAFVVALLNTTLLAAVTIVASSFLGLAIGAARLSSNWLVKRLGAMYVETFRNVPALLQIFFWYFVVLRQLPALHDSLMLPGGAVLNNRGLFLPELKVSGAFPIALAIATGLALAFIFHRLLRNHDAWLRNSLMIGAVAASLLAVSFLPGVEVAITPLVRGRFEYLGGFVLMPEFIALAAGLAMYNASYIAEIVRSGFRSIPPGQMEAAAALALPSAFTFWRVTLPQALRSCVPPMATVYANIFKATSLAAAIAYPDIVSVFVGTVNNLVGQPVEIMAVTLVTYAGVSFAIAAAMNYYNRRLQSRGIS